MANNLRGAFFLTKALHGRLNDNGRVINLSSVGARLSDPGIIVYTMAKAALDAFTRVMAAELGPRGITVNAVAPGFTAGETNDHVAQDPVAAKAASSMRPRCAASASRKRSPTSSMRWPRRWGAG